MDSQVVDEVTTEIVELTADLVEFRTTHDGWAEFEHPEEVAACLDYVAAYFDEEPFVVRRYGETAEGYDGEAFAGHEPSVYDAPKPSMVVSFEETTTPEYLLHGHVDVVSADADNYRASETDTAPSTAAHFDPLRENDRLYGRGTADMKLGVASLMRVMKTLGELPPADRPSVALMIVTDEEIGGFRGAGYLFRDVGYDPAFTISAEPSDPGDGFTVVTKQKGHFQLDVTAHGTPAHGSRPWKGDCANVKLVEFYRALADRFPTTTPTDRWQTTLNLGVIEGGETRTSLSETARAQLGIRFTDDYRPIDVMEDVADVVGVSVSGSSAAELAAAITDATTAFSFDVVNDEPMQQCDETDPYVERLLETATETTGVDHEPARKHGASDARFATYDGRPGVTFGPRGDNLHGPAEYADLTSVAPYYRSLVRFLTD